MGSRKSSGDYPSALLLPLQLIEPSPLLSPAISEHEDIPPKDITRGYAAQLSVVHRWSSYVFSGFLGLHLATTAFIPLITADIEIANKSILLARVLYQAPIVEATAVYGSLGVHILSGTALRIYRRRQKAKRYGKLIPWYKDMSTISMTGYALVPFVTFHSFITRGLPWLQHGGSEDISLHYVHFGFAKYPFQTWPLYIGLIGIASYHLVQGWSKWLHVPQRRRSEVNSLSAGLAAILLAGTVFISRTGTVSGHLGRIYNKLYATALKI